MSTKYATERQRSRTANRVTSDPLSFGAKGETPNPLLQPGGSRHSVLQLSAFSRKSIRHNQS